MNSVEKLLTGAALFYLLLCTVSDLRRRQISVPLSAAFLAAGIIMRICCGETTGLVQALLPGLFLYGLSYLTGGGIGSGDGTAVLVTGVLTGVSTALRTLSAASFLAGGYALFLLAVKKNRSFRIPFLPFLFLGFLTAVGEGSAVVSGSLLI
ncbi:MAG: prepilin peptidase [Lachnospiraceae bacterium]|nr:prepilin peptidase [Lachnospiraceae bacterium]